MKYRTAVLCALMSISILGWTHDAGAQVTVIANSTVPVDTLAKADLLKLFLGTTEYWDNQTRVVVVDLATKGNVRDSFYSYLGKTSSRMRSIWLKRKLTGEGELPESMASELALLDKVASTSGAIGFVSEAVAFNKSTAVKILISGIPLVEENN